MSESILSAPHFHNEEAAYKWVESHVWPDGPECPSFDMAPIHKSC